MAYYEYTGGGYAGNYGGAGTSGSQNYGRGYGGGASSGQNYAGYSGGGTGASYGFEYKPGGLRDLAQQAMGAGYGGRGGYGGAGAGAGYARGGVSGSYGYRTGGYGLGPSSGSATGYGPPPSRIGGTYDAPAIQSQRQLNAPGAISAGANYQQQGQRDTAFGQQSGAGQSMWEQLAGVLGGISPVSSAAAAEAPPQTSQQDTLTPEDIQAAPFKGPWTGTDTGTGRQLGAGAYGQLGPGGTEGQPNTNWAGYDPGAGGEAAPMGGAPPPAGTGAGWFSTAGNTVGGEAAPMGGAPPPSGAGWFSTAGNTLGGEAAPMGGAPAPTTDWSQPAWAEGAPPGGGPAPPGFGGDTGDTFASRFGAAPTTDWLSAADRLAFSGQTAETPGDAALRDRLASLTGSYPAPSGWPPDQTAKGDQLRIVPTTDQSTQLALQGVDATPPGGSLTGGGTGFDPGAFTGSTPGSFAQIPSGGQFDPNAFVGTNPPGQFQRGGATFGDDPNAFQPGVPGTVAGTETPPAPGSPADIAARGWQDAASPGGAPPPGPEAGVGGEAAPLGGAPPPAQVAGGEAAPPGGAVPPTQTAGGETVPTPRASSTAVGISSTGGAAGAPPVPSTGAQDARGQGVGRETDPQYNPPPNSLAGVISNMFGGGDLGNTVSKLMLQLGIPAALIFAATRGRGGGGNIGLVGGRSAMSGAGRGLFQPQLSRGLFPGTGVPNWLIPGVAGAMIGDRLANPQTPQSTQDHPPVSPGRGPAAPATPAARDDAGGRTFTVPQGGANMPMPVPHAAPDQGVTEASLGPGGMGGYTSAVFAIESNNDPNNVTGSNYGLGQFSIGQYGITAQNWRDPRVQQRAMQQETAQNLPALTRALGRQPSASELYIAHQQGLAGGTALLTADPNTPAWQAISRFYGSPATAARAIRGNLPDNLKGIPVQNITAGQFVAAWKARFNRAYVPYIRQQPPQVAMAG